MFKNPNKFIQFELWKECSLGCKFCCNKGQPKIDKVKSLRFILEKLNSDEMFNYDEIGFIGGEFFNGELSNSEVQKLFYQIFNKVATMSFIKIYITSALMFDMNKWLLPFLSHLEELNILNKVLICTSYDVEYRFHNKEQEFLWKTNVLLLHKLYPQMKIHTEVILTQSFIDAVLSDTFNINDFCKQYDTRLDYIEPSSGLFYYDKGEASKDMPNFFPTLSSFIKFLRKIDGIVDLQTLLSMELRSDRLYYWADNQRMIADNRRDGDGRCQLPSSKAKYEIGFIDSDKTMRDIVLTYLEVKG